MSNLNSLSPEDKAYFLEVKAANKGASDDAILAAMREQKAMDAGSAPSGPSAAPSGPMSYVQAGLDKLRDAVQAIDTLGGILPGTPKGSLVSPGDIVPGSPTEGAVMTATGLVPQGSGVKQFLARILGPALVGGTVGAAEGGSEGATKGAMLGGGATLLGEATRAGGYAKTKYDQRATVEAARAASDKAAPGLAAAIGDDVPALKGLARDPESLLAMRDPAVGKDALKTLFAQSDEEIINTFRGVRMAIPGLSDYSKEAKALAIQLGVTPSDPRVAQLLQAGGYPLYEKITAATALDKIKKLKAQAREAPDDALGFDLRQKAREAEGNFVDKLPARLREQYASAVENYDKGLDALDILKRSGIYGGDLKGAVLDKDKLREFLVQNLEKYPPSRFPKLYQTAFEGAPLGARDQSSIMYGPRVFLPNMGAVTGGSAGLPPQRFTQRVGETPFKLNPIVPQLMSIEAIRNAGKLKDAPAP